jgi:hypothetical protein
MSKILSDKSIRGIKHQIGHLSYVGIFSEEFLNTTHYWDKFSNKPRLLKEYFLEIQNRLGEIENYIDNSSEVPDE